MKSTLKNRVLACLLGLVVMVIAMGLFSGCGDQPTSPTSASDDPVVVNNTGKGSDGTAINGGNADLASVIKTKTKIKEPKTDSISVTKSVGPVGDTIKAVICPGGRTTGLFVPPGALIGQTEITMIVTQPRRIVGKQYEYEFGPHGLTFRFASTLYVDIPRPDGTRATLSWLNPETNLWEFQGTAVVLNGRASFTLINHFSKYGINYRGTGS